MKTVFVGLSGGVDSAVSAALLKSQGYSIVGAFIKIWRPEFVDCPWKKDRLDAMRVCAALEIPFKEIDLSDEYKKTVIDDMVRNYARGITPNPDVLCNRHIKFGAFAKWAFGNGADLIATGHYARISNDGRRTSIMLSKDTNKDQSYFLWQLTQDDLKKVLFPVGGYSKPEVRTLAKKFGLPVAAKKDSQGLCFVGDITLRDFLSHYLPLEKGRVLNESGTVIGDHDGAALFTLGERHGFRIRSDVPQYVIAIDVQKNSIIVSPDRNKTARQQVKLIDTNLRAEGGSFMAQARYREEPVPCELKGTTVVFTSPHLAPPGQSLVLYDGDICVGGGTIAA